MSENSEQVTRKYSIFGKDFFIIIYHYNKKYILDGFDLPDVKFEDVKDHVEYLPRKRIIEICKNSPKEYRFNKKQMLELFDSYDENNATQGFFFYLKNKWIYKNIDEIKLLNDNPLL
jgi:hypothetical protein